MRKIMLVLIIGIGLAGCIDNQPVNCGNSGYVQVQNPIPFDPYNQLYIGSGSSMYNTLTAHCSTCYGQGQNPYASLDKDGNGDWQLTGTSCS